MTTNLIHIVEAIIFAAGVAIKRSDILAKLPEGTTRKDLNDAIKGLEQKYQDPCGIVLLCIGDKVQFASNKEYGDIVAAALKPVKERELSRALLEVMSIVAYKQPVTRGEIEDIRGGRSADYAIARQNSFSNVSVSEISTICPITKKFSTGWSFSETTTRSAKGFTEKSTSQTALKKRKKRRNRKSLNVSVWRENSTSLSTRTKAPTFSKERSIRLSKRTTKRRHPTTMMTRISQRRSPKKKRQSRTTMTKNKTMYFNKKTGAHACFFVIYRSLSNNDVCRHTIISLSSLL